MKLQLYYIHCNSEVTIEFETVEDVFNYILAYNNTHSQQISEFEVSQIYN